MGGQVPGSGLCISALDVSLQSNICSAGVSLLLHFWSRLSSCHPLHSVDTSWPFLCSLPKFLGAWTVTYSLLPPVCFQCRVCLDPSSCLWSHCILRLWAKHNAGPSSSVNNWAMCKPSAPQSTRKSFLSAFQCFVASSWIFSQECTYGLPRFTGCRQADFAEASFHTNSCHREAAFTTKTEGEKPTMNGKEELCRKHQQME